MKFLITTTLQQKIQLCAVWFSERLDGIVVGSIGGTVTATVTTDVDSISIPVGGVDTVHAKINPRGKAYTWASADTSTATVANGLSDADVVITGVAAGTVNVTCTVGEGASAVTKTIAVTVTA